MPTDSTGTVHTDRCWSTAVITVNEEIMLQSLPAAAPWFNEDERVEMWDGAIVGNVVADWLSDGTTSCRCSD